MKTFPEIFIFILAFLLNSCSNEEECIQEKEKPLNVIVKYNADNQTNKDINATIYIYYGKCEPSLETYRYISDGIFKHPYHDLEKKPDLIESMNGKEIYKTTLKKSEYYTIVIESSFYKNKITINSVFPNDFPVNIDITFYK